jgi:hypothetical protein
MRLYGIEPHPTRERMDLRTYVCIACEAVETQAVPLAAKSPRGKGTAMAMDRMLASGAFDEATTKILTSAFDAAWATVAASGSPLSQAPSAEPTRERLARSIIELGRRGETNRNRLVENALARLVDAQAPPTPHRRNGSSL